MKRIINTQTLEVLKNSVLNTIAKASSHIEAAKANQLNTVSQKFTNFNNWYMRITGLDKVILAQEKVTALQVSSYLTISEQCFSNFCSI